LRYEIDVNHPETWRYTEEKRALQPPPFFDEDAAIEVKRSEAGVTSFSFPQAIAHECIYRYHITIAGDDGFRHEVDYSSVYFMKPMPEKLTVPLADLLTKGVTYTVTVDPFDAFEKKGEPLVTVFRA